MSHSCVYVYTYESQLCVCIYIWVTVVCMYIHMSHSCVYVYTYESTIEQLFIWRPYGLATISRLLQILCLFCKRANQRDYILLKRPVILRRLLIVATPYANTTLQLWTYELAELCVWCGLISRLLKLWVSFAKNYGSLLRDCGRMSSQISWKGKVIEEQLSCRLCIYILHHTCEKMYVYYIWLR